MARLGAAVLGILLQASVAQTSSADEAREFDVRIHRAYDAHAVRRALAGASARV